MNHADYFLDTLTRIFPKRSIEVRPILNFTSSQDYLYIVRIGIPLVPNPDPLNRGGQGYHRAIKDETIDKRLDKLSTEEWNMGDDSYTYTKINANEEIILTIYINE